MFATSNTAWAQEDLDQSSDPDFTSHSGGCFDTPVFGANTPRVQITLFPQRKSRGDHIPPIDSRQISEPLAWLATQQHKDGSWRWINPKQTLPYQQISANQFNLDIAATSLALLSFSANGNSTSTGEYSLQMKRGNDWLRSLQKRQTGEITSEPSGNALLSHALATQALTEVYFYSKNPILKRHLRPAVRHSLNAQIPWSAWPCANVEKFKPDALTTAWMTQALLLADECKVSIPKTAYTSAIEWIKPSTTQKNTEPIWLYFKIVYPFPKTPTAITEHPFFPLLDVVAKSLSLVPPKDLNEMSFRELQEEYFLSQALFQWGGPNWTKHYEALSQNFRSTATFPSPTLNPAIIALQTLILQTPTRYNRIYSTLE
ncbi:MAG: hypothetical protein HQ519_01050 [Planctomycetes bacterium]|nr:hypothetical protein [Planctomycetota bacterium]